MSNEITIKGSLVADPELKYTSSGVAVTSLRIADNTNKRNKDTNEWEQVGETIWWNVSVWNELAEAVADQLKKGDYVKVTGPITFREYDAKDGTKGRSNDLRAVEVVKPVTRKKNNNAGGGYSQPATNNVVSDDETPF